MDDSKLQAHVEHLKHEQDHYRWTADHMRALAILKRAEAHLLAHEAEIAAHRAEIARHEEVIAHGDDHAPEPPEGDHAAMAKAHEEAGKNHGQMVQAIFDLEKLL